jgi:eukaryotic-like serine/threonine-protein kinase
VTAPRTQSVPPDLLGTVVEGRYRIRERLGGGAAGAVYRADDLGGGAPLAIKVWHQSVLEPQTAGRFQRETKALSTLVHPNILAIRDYGLLDGMPFLATELLEGISLEALIGRGPLPLETAIAIVKQVLSALSFAHAQQVVHRDLKPDNVFLTRAAGGGYHVKVLDFGLAKFLEPQADPLAGSALTKRGALVGTPLYMAPEQALGRAIDARTDVYAIGCVLYELLAGEPPFTAGSLTELLRAHLVQPIPRLAARRPDLSGAEALQRVIDRALSKQADERFANAAEMLAALEAVHPSGRTAPPQVTAARPPAAAPRPAAMSAALPAAADAEHARRKSGSALTLIALATATLCAALWWLLR